MAAWTELEKVNIRRYLGVSNTFVQFDPAVEQAIVAALATADGGNQPDSTLQTVIQSTLTDLETLEADQKALWKQASASKIDELIVDPARALFLLRAEGRRLVGYLSDHLNVRPRRDVFSAKAPGYEQIGDRHAP